MDAPRATKAQCPWRPCLTGLLLQLLLALCFFSYIRVSYDQPGPPAPGSSPGPASSPATPVSRPLLILLWTWPFHNQVALPPCSKMLPGTADCRLTANRNLYPQADAVIIHHREVSANPRSLLPPQPRPPGQRWVWFSMESPSHCSRLSELDGHFNLTMSYRADSDIFTPYGWLEPWPEPPVQTQVNLSAKTDLVAWAVSNWKSKSARVLYYQKLQSHLHVDVYGRGHMPLPQGDMMQTLARYKFYLAFENSLHPDYITEKLWKNALEAWAVPVVLGPSRKNYERFLPPDAFIHVDDFQSPKDLAQYLQELDRDSLSYQRYFRWRKTLRPRLWSMSLAFCKACRQLQWDQRYQTVSSVASWFH
ncbi:3-galactosyl-N-acetylglucosaminide 4-alpha-L-fucosyltransferase FUT3-like [Peromyscus leucopus]|uniref:3-galactosyl-N-acetylglucosaminide 4-alpha-L-fucosyltransferase FUT3-like n=1 Tax=Peromyscus leucopus TaxID=10041 RepID=UPI0010A17AEB|nr:3-galactosyl-N-acetylglucosaminide 4-alpha-L-fucosyltransferase FUT3-like [Peromyscus leucopus]XP_037053740.1 3-galactosyl-N-acetylglucosaminide 4-alpha-L-fucosyltransferase FUT3-like [Peromyscus leucopus]